MGLFHPLMDLSGHISLNDYASQQDVGLVTSVGLKARGSYRCYIRYANILF